MAPSLRQKKLTVALTNRASSPAHRRSAANLQTIALSPTPVSPEKRTWRPDSSSNSKIAEKRVVSTAAMITKRSSWPLETRAVRFGASQTHLEPKCQSTAYPHDKRMELDDLSNAEEFRSQRQHSTASSQLEPLSARGNETVVSPPLPPGATGGGSGRDGRRSLSRSSKKSLKAARLESAGELPPNAHTIAKT